MILHINGFPLDKNDDRGKPPFPLLKTLTENELEYLWRYVDHYTHKPINGKVVGRLIEFDE